jgi:hypothetical protein
MPIEAGGLIILRIDDECKNCTIGNRGPPRGINHHHAANPLPPEILVNRETAYQAGRQNPIARQTFRLTLWEFE